jgi:hypothetical protein
MLIGRVVSALPVLLLAMSAVMKLSGRPEFVDQFSGKFGYQAQSLPAIAVLELACALVYAIPRTAVLGAILVTGYLGGAVATHVRIGDVFAPPLVIGILAWVGLYLREGRLRALLPLRKPADDATPNVQA